MRVGPRSLLVPLVATALSALGACGDEGGAAMQLPSCPANYETCSGTKDCVSGCVCDGTAFGSCMQRCGGDGGPYVSELDDDAWDEAWSAFEAEVLERTNAARAKGGCCGDEGCFAASGPLKLDARLRRSARAHADDMGEHGYFDHASQDGRTPFDRMREAGFKRCAMGENIAAGQPDPASVMKDWLRSPGHCANILQPAFEFIGVGYSEAGDQAVWVQNFGG